MWCGMLLNVSIGYSGIGYRAERTCMIEYKKVFLKVFFEMIGAFRTLFTAFFGLNLNDSNRCDIWISPIISGYNY